MILEKTKLKDKLYLEIVNKDDIMDSYKNNKLVSSCMSEKGRWKYTRLYNYVKDLKLLRIMKDNTLVLRTLLWNVTDTEKQKFNFIDKVYFKSYPSSNCRRIYCYGCSYCLPKVAHPTAYEQFKEIWPKYADVRNTNKHIFAEVLPNKIRIWPYMDNFIYYNKNKKLLSNKYIYDDNDDFECYEDIFINALDHIYD